MTDLHTAIARGIDRGLRDLGADVVGCTPSMLTGHVINELREAGLHPSPLPDSETEWGWDPDSEFPGDVIVAVDEAAARERAGAARGRLLMQRRAPGPWIEVTS